MPNLPKNIITDKEGNQVLPITHVSAVYDDNGTPVETLITNIEESMGVPTVLSKPISSTTTYTKGGETYDYKIGQFCRVQTQNGYDFYQLLDLVTEDNTTTATWVKVNNAVYSTMGASGSSHTGGLVPDPGATAGTTKYLREDGTWQVPSDNNTTYGLTINGTTNGDSNGTSLGTIYAPTTTGTSGQVWKSNGSGGAWGSLSYTDVTYTVYVPSSSSSGAISADYTNGPVQVITLSGNASSVTTSNIPAGHSLHIIFRSNSTSTTRTVAIAHNSSTSCCPEGTALSLTVPKQGSGYTEVDFINVNSIIYVRGV